MPRTRSRKWQESVTWKAFADYIKMRDAIRTTGTLAEVHCMYCGRRHYRAESQAGHMISRTYGNALYNPKVVFASCSNCNLYREGNHVSGYLNLVEMVGPKQASSIVIDAMKPKPYTMEELEDIEEGCLAAVEIMESYYEAHAR
ncbi:MAG: recombination protein NinG [Coriobacteriia bacterium]|nr:recombination protein NinG [Coriobacteriia bacterium]